MPINDFAGPIIQAFMAGQDIARKKKNDEEEKKMREARVKQIESEIQSAQKRDQLAEQASKAQHAQAVETIKAHIVDQIMGGKRKMPTETVQNFGSNPQSAEMIGSLNQAGNTNPLDYQNSALPQIQSVAQTVPAKKYRVTPDFAVDLTDIPSRVDYRKSKEEDQQDALKYQAQLASIKEAPRRDTALAVAGVNNSAAAARNKETLDNRKDLQAELIKSHEKIANAKIEQEKNALTVHERIAKTREWNENVRTAATLENRLAVANVNHAGNTAEQLNGIGQVFKRVEEGAFTMEDMKALNKDSKQVLEFRAANAKLKILTKREYDNLANIRTLMDHRRNAEEIIKQIGDGSVQGVFSQGNIGTAISKMKGEIPQILKGSGVVGNVSDKEAEAAAATYLPKSFQALGSLRKSNEMILERFDRAAYRVFRSVFPKGQFNVDQEVAAAKAWKIPYAGVIEKFDKEGRK